MPERLEDIIEAAVEDACFYQYRGQRVFRWAEQRITSDEPFIRDMAADVTMHVLKAIRESQTIHTSEQLDALPEMSVIHNGLPWTLIGSDEDEGSIWGSPAGRRKWGSRMQLPAVLLWTPEVQS